MRVAAKLTAGSSTPTIAIAVTAEVFKNAIQFALDENSEVCSCRLSL